MMKGQVSLILFLLIVCQFNILHSGKLAWAQEIQKTDLNTSWFSAPNGVSVSIDPDELFGEGLTRAWRRLDECSDGVRIKGRPYSKVNFVVEPIESFDGATLRVFLNGSSAGVTKSSNAKVEIETDSLTHFRAFQLAHVSTAGISFSQPEIKVKANQSFKKAKGKKNGFAALIAASAYRNFPKDLQRRSQKITHEIVQKQLYESMGEINRVVARAVADFSHRFPAIANQDWQLASGSKQILIYSSLNNNGVDYATLPPQQSSPMEIRIHEDYLNEYAKEKLGGAEVEAKQFRDFFRRNFSNAKENSDLKTKPWSLKFADQSLDFSFVENKLNVRINAAKVNALGRELENIGAVFAFRIVKNRATWLLQRDSIRIVTEHSGARQQMARSIIRQRLESIIPEQISVPDFGGNEDLKQLDLVLGVKDISAGDNSLLISIDHK